MFYLLSALFPFSITLVLLKVQHNIYYLCLLFLDPILHHLICRCWGIVSIFIATLFLHSVLIYIVFIIIFCSILFHYRNRNVHGIRLLWNKGKPLDFGTKWNPFTNNIPFVTFTSHPLVYYKGKEFYGISQNQMVRLWLLNVLNKKKIR